ncbi:MAG: MotA/TolQ/ExbB proton channel family protein [Myxococcota bacterium]
MTDQQSAWNGVPRMWNHVCLLLLQGGASDRLDVSQLVLEASPMVKGVMLILVAMSLGCWLIVFSKAIQLVAAGRSSSRFLDCFWGDDAASWDAERLEGIYAQVRAFGRAPLAAVFRSGYVELARVMGAGQSSSGHYQASQAGDYDIENVERALRRTANNELTGLEAMLPFLATTGATAPFIGLFGTVWGIMNSFIGIRNEGSTGLEAVAPGIAEALVVTAIGLLAAIPAVMAYNFFVRKIQVLESEMNAFQYDYLNIVRRHFLRS